MSGYIAIDIETTGHFKDDLVFAYGQSDIGDTGDHTGDTTYVKQACPVSSSVVLNLHKPKESNWKEFWIKKNWSMTCFTDFWQHNLDILDYLQNPQNVLLVETEEEFVKKINKMMTEAENRYSKTTIISDTLLFDTVMVSGLLQKYNYAGLYYTRDCKYYRRGIEVNSYAFGLFNLGSEDYVTRKSVINTFKKNPKNFLFETTYNHDPKEDSKSILHFWLMLKNYKK